MDRAHTRVIRGYQGSVERPSPMIKLYAPHPYAGEVTVTVLKRRGIGERFEVDVKWLGPPLAGSLPSLGVPVHANDLIMLEDEQTAREVANRARNALARGELPDLWVLSGQVRTTSHGA